MNIELIKEKVRLVKLSHEGKSIIEIFRDLNFVIGYLDNNYPYINETKGCNIKTTKLRAVLLNPNLCENELTEVLTHELGHVYVHPNINTFKIHEIDPVWVKHLELEADTFASEYLLDDDIFEKYINLSFEQLASELCISLHLVMLKFNNLSISPGVPLPSLFLYTDLMFLIPAFSATFISFAYFSIVISSQYTFSLNIGSTLYLS